MRWSLIHDFEWPVTSCYRTKYCQILVIIFRLGIFLVALVFYYPHYFMGHLFISLGFQYLPYLSFFFCLRLNSIIIMPFITSSRLSIVTLTSRSGQLSQLEQLPCILLFSLLEVLCPEVIVQLGQLIFIVLLSLLGVLCSEVIVDMIVLSQDWLALCELVDTFPLLFSRQTGSFLVGFKYWR